MVSVLAIWAFELVMLVICSTIVNEAIWLTDSFVSIGLVGSWCVSWAMNSFRKPSLSSVPLAFIADCVPICVCVVAAAALVEGVVLIERKVRSEGQARTSTWTPSGRTRTVSAATGDSMSTVSSRGPR